MMITCLSLILLVAGLSILMNTYEQSQTKQQISSIAYTSATLDEIRESSWEQTKEHWIENPLEQLEHISQLLNEEQLKTDEIKERMDDVVDHLEQAAFYFTLIENHFYKHGRVTITYMNTVNQKYIDYLRKKWIPKFDIAIEKENKDLLADLRTEVDFLITDYTMLKEAISPYDINRDAPAEIATSFKRVIITITNQEDRREHFFYKKLR
ncbi:hypothetical protein M3231_02500 [Neobacillus mesonae]|nr:hypothetical protein [Neobacillus mesonae]